MIVLPTSREGQHDEPSQLVTVLPDLVWRSIVTFLSDSLRTLLNVASLNSDLARICRPHISAFFHEIRETVPPLSSTYYFQDVLWMVLEGFLDASCITEFSSGGRYKLEPPILPPPATVGTFATSATPHERRRFEQNFREAIRASLFIPSDLESQIFSRFHKGYVDAALVVLLPLCTRLKVLEPPVGLELCSALFQGVSKEHERRGTNAYEAREHGFESALRDRNTKRPAKPTVSSDALPFPELLILNTYPYQFAYPHPLAAITPFMGIPSLQRIILSSLRDQTFPTWPTGEAKVTCPEIYFNESSVSRQAALAFAEGVVGPCEIKQFYSKPRPDVSPSEPGDPNWDHVLIHDREGVDRSVDVRLDYEGGHPVSHYPWVSWLCTGRMGDWRRIDKEFVGYEDDGDVDWLYSCLL